MLILLLFFCSGATALVYEVVWSKYLTLMFGSTVQAQTVVLSVFMGGLALGNRLFGRLADRAKQPLVLYGYLEVGIGLYAFFFPWIFQLADGLFVLAGTPLLETGNWLLALKGLLSVGLLLGPTLLMGGTLPLVAAWLQRETADASRRSARFYSINSFGAVVGAGLAGFVLVREFGLVVATQLAAVTNVLVGFIAVGVVRYREQNALSSRPVPAPNPTDLPEPQTAPVPATPVDARKLQWACAMVAVTGGISMGLEVLSARFLTLIFGASLQAFAVVLMAFILGIGIGASVVASPRFRRWHTDTTPAVVLLAAAAIIGMLVMSIEQWVDFYRVARSGLARTTVGYQYNQFLNAVLSIIVLGVPAALLGSVLPLWIRALGGAEALLGERVGRLLTWNTVGAVVGVLCTGFILMPVFGLRGSFGFMAILLSGAALAIAWRYQQRYATVVSSGFAGLLLVVCLAGGQGWKQVLSSGVFRSREAEVDKNAMEERKRLIRLLFYEDAADATVSVEQDTTNPSHLALRINGKTDASTRADLGTQYLLGHLPLLAKPASKDVFVLGFGSGITAGAVLTHPVERLTVAENCAPVLRAAKLFERWNRGVLTNRNARVWREDARTVLKLSPQKYDVIISEPSNPWMIGVGSVFSEEFYELAASRLKEGGIMTQWFHLYEMHDGIVSMVLKTFATVFPYVEIWDTGPGDIVLLGSKQPWPSSPEIFRPVFARELARKDLESIGIKSPEAVWARQLASQRTGFAVPGDVPVQSDAFPILEYEAPEAFYLGNSSRLLFRYDERQRQRVIAPAEKQGTLAALTPETLKAVFAEFHSANVELQRHIMQRLNAPTNHPALDSYAAARNEPCIFFPVKSSMTNDLQIPPGTSAESQRLLEAEYLILTNPDQWLEGVTAIEAILQSREAMAKLNPQVVVQFGVAAIRACLRHRNYDQARKVLDLTLQLEPENDELHYLARLWEREHTAGTPAAPPAP